MVLWHKSPKMGRSLRPLTIPDFGAIMYLMGTQNDSRHIVTGEENEKRIEKRKKGDRSRPVHPFSALSMVAIYLYTVGLLIWHRRASSERLI